MKRQGPETVTIIAHGISITINNPRRLPKQRVFQDAMRRYGNQIKLSVGG